MEFIKKLFPFNTDKLSKRAEAIQNDAALKDLAIKEEEIRQLHHARGEYLQSMAKVEFHTANARAAEQTIKRLEAVHVSQN